MKNIRKIATFALSAAFILFAGAGCNKFLDQLPDDRTKISNLEDLEKLLATAYPLTTHIGFTEFRADGYRDYGAGLFDLNLEYFTSAFQWSPVEINPNDGNSQESYWESCYKAIAVANHALGALKELGYPAEGEWLRSEAYMTRAYAHFCLATLYTRMFERGKESVNPGIPYVYAPEEVIHEQYERETVEETLRKVWVDFERASRSLGKGVYQQPKFRFSTSSAYAFAVRYNLYTENYAGVIGYANRLIGNPTMFENVVDANNNPVAPNADGSAKLIVSPQDPVYIFLGNNLLDREAIKAISAASEIGRQYSNPLYGAVLLASEVQSTHSLACQGRAYGRYSFSPSAANVMLTKNASGGSWNYRTLGVSGDDVGFTPKGWHDFKYKDVVAGIGNYYTRIALFRMEEVLLSRAEAYTLIGDYNSALFDLNMYLQKRITSFKYNTTHALTKDKVMEYYDTILKDDVHYINSTYNEKHFAGLSDDEKKLKKALIMTVLDFRRSEFVYEGMRYFDVLRWNIPVEHATADGRRSTLTENDPRRVIELPETVVLSGLERNNVPFQEW